jgi:hypothetical protein
MLRTGIGVSQKRAHAPAASSLPRAIHKLDSANKVMSCAVFFLSRSIADLGVAELPLDDPERMLDLGPDACLDPLDLIDERVKRPAFVQNAPLPGFIATCQFTPARASGRL